MKHKLIMENWRRFLKENLQEESRNAGLDEQVELQQEGVMTGVLAALFGLTLSSGEPPSGVEFQSGQELTQKQTQALINYLDKNQEEHPEAHEDLQTILTNAEHNAIESGLNPDKDGDGYLNLEEPGPHLMPFIDYLAKKNAPQDDTATDTGSPTLDMKGGNIDVQAKMFLQTGQDRMSPEQKVAKAEELLSKGRQPEFEMSPDTEKALQKIIQINSK